MTLRDFRIGWRLLLKEPGYSLAVVLGLAVGLAVCFLLLGFVRYSVTYNRAIPDSEQIFVVKERRKVLSRPDWVAAAPAPLRQVVTVVGAQATATSAKAFDLTASRWSRRRPPRATPWRQCGCRPRWRSGINAEGLTRGLVNGHRVDLVAVGRCDLPDQIDAANKKSYVPVK